jgi:hypothetical protein
MGRKLVRVNANGTYVTLGDVGTGGLVSMDYGFGRLAVTSGGRLYYWDGTALTQVVDPDLGSALDVIWVDGYYMVHDGTNLIVTDLSDPTQVNPLKYGSSEVDPDPLLALVKIRNEPYAVNRYTIEVFTNIGGTAFPFQRVPGAQITRGSVGTHTCCAFDDGIAFMGGGRNEPIAIWLGANATATRASTPEIETILRGYSEATLAEAKLEAIHDKLNHILLVHLPDKTLALDLTASKAVSGPVWSIMTSGVASSGQFRARDYCWARGRWEVGDPAGAALGYIDGTTGHHWGQVVGWEFSTRILYNDSRGAVIHEMELVSIARNIPHGANPVITTSYSTDGQTWSQDRPIRLGTSGQRDKRLVWRTQGFMRNWRIQRFRGDSTGRASFARLEAQFESLGA